MIDKMKICVYTCITGGYDGLKDPIVITKDIDYICFCDRPIKSKVWKWRQIPDELKYLDNIRKQRIIKICPHKYLSEYDVSIWIDGSFKVIGNVHKFIAQYDLNKFSFFTRKHSGRDCIYMEAQECIRLNKDNHTIINRQMNRYIQEKYPKHNGLIESGLILRRHNDIQCQKMMNYWASEILNESYRDQLSFNYICWKHHFSYGILTNESSLSQNKYFISNNTHVK